MSSSPQIRDLTLFYLTCWHLWNPSLLRHARQSLGGDGSKFKKRHHYYPLGAYNPIKGMHINPQNNKKHIYGPTCQWEQINTKILQVWNIFNWNCFLLGYGLQWSVKMCLHGCQKHDLKLSHLTIHLSFIPFLVTFVLSTRQIIHLQGDL